MADSSCNFRQQAKSMTHNTRAQIGILMLESRFPRFRGDIGHPKTFDPPAIVRTVRTASPRRVVEGQAFGLLDGFVKAAKDLQQAGARLITTSCGFLVLHQAALAGAVDVPLVSSSLLAVPPAARKLRAHGLRPAILTISSENLTRAHLDAAGCPPDIPIGAPEPDSHFCTQILGNRTTMDKAIARQDVIAAARKLMDCHEGIGALILECTNMPPYASDLAELFRIPILSLPSLLPYCQSGLGIEAATVEALENCQ